MDMGSFLVRAFYQGKKSTDLDPGSTSTPEKTVRGYLIFFVGTAVLAVLVIVTSLLAPSPSDSTRAVRAANAIGRDADQALPPTSLAPTASLDSLATKQLSTMDPTSPTARGEALSVVADPGTVRSALRFLVRNVIMTRNAGSSRTAASTQWACLTFYRTGSFLVYGRKC